MADLQALVLLADKEETISTSFMKSIDALKAVSVKVEPESGEPKSGKSSQAGGKRKRRRIPATYL